MYTCVGWIFFFSKLLFFWLYHFKEGGGHVASFVGDLCNFGEMSSCCLQAFKLIVTDPDSVLSGLTKEIKEANGDEAEVGSIYFMVLA